MNQKYCALENNISRLIAHTKGSNVYINRTGNLTEGKGELTVCHHPNFDARNRTLEFFDPFFDTSLQFHSTLSPEQLTFIREDRILNLHGLRVEYCADADRYLSLSKKLGLLKHRTGLCGIHKESATHTAGDTSVSFIYRPEVFPPATLFIEVAKNGEVQERIDKSDVLPTFDEKEWHAVKHVCDTVWSKNIGVNDIQYAAERKFVRSFLRATQSKSALFLGTSPDVNTTYNLSGLFDLRVTPYENLHVELSNDILQFQTVTTEDGKPQSFPPKRYEDILAQVRYDGGEVYTNLLLNKKSLGRGLLEQNLSKFGL